MSYKSKVVESIITNPISASNCRGSSCDTICGSECRKNCGPCSNECDAICGYGCDTECVETCRFTCDDCSVGCASTCSSNVGW